MPLEPRTINRSSSKYLANFARQIVDHEISALRFLRDSREGLVFFYSFTCRVLYMRYTPSKDDKNQNETEIDMVYALFMKVLLSPKIHK